MKISTCLIVKNEEEKLHKCLQSISSISDEIIIVDTGSNDRTINIALDFTKQVYEIPWTNNYSEARNFSIKHAKNPWILVIDADEYLLADSQKNLTDYIVTLSQKDIFVYNFLVIAEDQQPMFSRALFPNYHGISFKGKVHEYLRLNGHSIPEINCPNIILNHNSGSLSQRQCKAKKYLKIINQELSYENLAWFEYATYLRHRADANELLGNIELALDDYLHIHHLYTLSSHPKKHMFYINLLQRLIMLSIEVKNDFLSAYPFVLEMTELEPKVPEGWFYKAYICLNCHNILEGLDAVHKALEILNSGIETALLNKILLTKARLMFFNNQPYESLEILKNIVQQNPLVFELQLHLARAYITNQKPESAYILLKKWFPEISVIRSDWLAALLGSPIWTEAEKSQITQLLTS